MADYHLILKRAVEREPGLDADGRRAIYDKARAALDRQLASLDPPPAEEQVARVRGSLEDAVLRLEEEFGPADPTPAEDEAPATLIATPSFDPAPDAPPESAETLIVPPSGGLAPPQDDAASAQALAKAAALVDGAARTLSQTEPADDRPTFDETRLEDSPPHDDASDAQPDIAPDEASPTLAIAQGAETSAETGAEDDAESADHEPAFVGEVEVETIEPEWDAGPTTEPKAGATEAEAPLAPQRKRGLRGAAKTAKSSEKAAKSGRREGLPEALAKRQKGRSAWPVAAILLLLVAVIAVVGVWRRDDLMAAVQAPEPVESSAVIETGEETPGKNEERITASGIATAPEDTTENAIRDVGGEAVATAPTTTTAALPTTGTATETTPPAASVDGSAVLYEERLLAKDQGDSFPGTVTWTAEEEPGADGVEQTILRGLVKVPARNLDVLLTIRRNDDETLPASHTIELLFETGEGFTPGGVANVMGILMKPTAETQLGTPLKGASARITDGYFLIGLSSLAQDEAKNVELLQEEPRLEIPILYNNGQRAILELQKGSDGATAFADAFGAWAGG